MDYKFKKEENAVYVTGRLPKHMITWDIEPKMVGTSTDLFSASQQLPSDGEL